MMMIYSVWADSKAAFSEKKHAFQIHDYDKELGGHGWAGIEYWGGMCGLVENRRGHAYCGIE